MATKVKQLVESQIIAVGVLYAPPLGVIATIDSAMLCNTTGGTVNCTVYITGPSVGVGGLNTFISAHPVEAGETYLCPELINQKVSPLHEIHAVGAGVTFAVGGLEVDVV